MPFLVLTKQREETYCHRQMAVVPWETDCLGGADAGPRAPLSEHSLQGVGHLRDPVSARDLQTREPQKNIWGAEEAETDSSIYLWNLKLRARKWLISLGKGERTQHDL